MHLLSYENGQIKEKTQCQHSKAMSLSGIRLSVIYFFSPQALSFNCQKSKGR